MSSKLVDMVKADNLALLKKSIHGKSDLAVQDNDKKTLLHIAAEENKFSIAKFLIKKGANVNALDRHGWTPLHCAAAKQHLKMCDLLIKKGKADCTLMTGVGRATVLSYLARANMINPIELQTLMQTVLESGGFINDANENGETALHFAIMHGMIDTVEWLLKSKANPFVLTIRNDSTLHYAVRSNRADILSCLLNYGVNHEIKNNSGSSPVAEAQELNKMAMANLIKDFINKSKMELKVFGRGSTIIGGAPRYYSTIYVPPNNANLIVLGGQTKPGSDAAEESILENWAIFDFAESKWNSPPTKILLNLDKPKLTQMASAIVGKYIYVIAGREANGLCKTVRIFDTGAIKWHGHTIREASTGLSGSAAVVVSGAEPCFHGSRQKSRINLGASADARQLIQAGRVKAILGSFEPPKSAAPDELSGSESEEEEETEQVEQKTKSTDGKSAKEATLSAIELELKKMQKEGLVPSGSSLGPSERPSDISAEDQRRIICFGGLSKNGPINTLYTLNIGSENMRSRTTRGTMPEPRYFHTLNLIKRNLMNDLFLFGGTDGTKCFGNAFYLSLDSLSWISIPSSNAPSPRHSHASLVLKDVVVISGGTDQNGAVLNDLWAFYIKKNIWCPVPLPVSSSFSARSGHVMFQYGERICLYGGNDSSNIESISMDFVTKAVSAEENEPSVTLSTPASSSSSLAQGGPLDNGTVTVDRKMSMPPRLLSSANTPAKSDNSSADLLVPTSEEISRVFSFDDNDEDSGNDKPLIQHIEELEEFSNSMTKEVLNLVRIVQTELNSPDALKNPQRSEELKKLCEILLEMGETYKKNNKPKEKSSSKILGSKGKKKFVFNPYPMQYYEALAAPPKFVPPSCTIEGDDALAKQLKHRFHVVNEIVQTETDYVRDLALIVGCYLRPLNEIFQDLISSYDVNILFKNIENLLEVNTNLLKFLNEELKKDPAEQSIGGTFLNSVTELKKYNIYCANQVAAQELAESLFKKNLDFQVMCQEVKKLEVSNNNDIFVSIIKPFQRITRYPLLLKELHKVTPPEWNDYTKQTEAMEAIDIIVKAANETKRVTDDVFRSLEITSKFEVQDKEIIGLTKEPFITEFSVEEIDSKGKTNKCIVLIFERSLILASPQKNKKLAKLDRLDLYDAVASALAPAEMPPNAKDSPLGVRISRKDIRKNKHILVAGSMEEKEKLISTINDLAAVAPKPVAGIGTMPIGTANNAAGATSNPIAATSSPSVPPANAAHAPPPPASPEPMSPKVLSKPKSDASP